MEPSPLSSSEGLVVETPDFGPNDWARLHASVRPNTLTAEAFRTLVATGRIDAHMSLIELKKITIVLRQLLTERGRLHDACPSMWRLTKAGLAKQMANMVKQGQRPELARAAATDPRVSATGVTARGISPTQGTATTTFARASALDVRTAAQLHSQQHDTEQQHNHQPTGLTAPGTCTAPLPPPLAVGIYRSAASTASTASAAAQSPRPMSTSSAGATPSPGPGGVSPAMTTVGKAALPSPRSSAAALRCPPAPSTIPARTLRPAATAPAPSGVAPSGHSPAAVWEAVRECLPPTGCGAVVAGYRPWCSPLLPIVADVKRAHIRAGSTQHSFELPTALAAEVLGRRLRLLAVPLSGAFQPAPWPKGKDVFVYMNNEAVQGAWRRTWPRPGVACAYLPLDLSAQLVRGRAVQRVQVDCFVKDYAATMALVVAAPVAEADLAAALARVAPRPLELLRTYKAVLGLDIEHDDDVQIAAAPLLSAKCPVSQVPMVVPVRAAGCRHAQAVDLAAYLRASHTAGFWNCPLCDGSMRLDEIVVDHALREALAAPVAGPGGERARYWQLHVSNADGATGPAGLSIGAFQWVAARHHHSSARTVAGTTAAAAGGIALDDDGDTSGSSASELSRSPTRDATTVASASGVPLERGKRGRDGEAVPPPPPSLPPTHSDVHVIELD